MFKFVSFIFVSSLIAFSLTACSTMTPNTVKRAYCNMLKSDLVFNGQTGITRDANIQNSETPLDQRSYDAADCADQN